MALKNFIVFLAVFLMAQGLHGGDDGFKYSRNYSFKEYDHQPQNWGVIQANSGIIYVANNGGVLEFDGVSWRVIKVPGYDHVRSIAVDETGTIYIGGMGKIGYLAPGRKGRLNYVSLLDRLDDDQKEFSTVWKTFAIGQHVYFYTSKFLFRWNPGRKKMVGLEHGGGVLLNCGRELYFRSGKAGLERIAQIEKGGLKTVPLPGGEIFAKKKIYMMTPYKEISPKLLVGTEQNGFYIHDGTSAIPFPTEVDGYLKKNKLFHGIRLTSGDFALATRRGGIVVMTSRGRLKYIFNKISGLKDDTVNYVFEDNRGNLWLCLNKGISKIEYGSPIFFHDERSHLAGLILSIIKRRDHLYVGTTKGLYFLESPFKFRLIPGMGGYCRSLLSTRGALLAASPNGVFQVDENHGIKRVIKEKTFSLLSSLQYPGRTWCGTGLGLIALSQKNGQWMEECRIKDIKQEVNSIVEDKKGCLWFGTPAGRILKVDSPVTGNRPVVTSYGASQGLPGSEVYVAEAAGHVVFASGKGLYRFEEKEKKFIPDQTLGVDFAGGSRPVFRIAEDRNKHIWFTSESMNYRAVPAPGGGFTIHSKALRRIPISQVNVIYPAPDGKTVWFGNYDGLVRYDTTMEKDYSQDFKTLVRKVLINGELLFDGYENSAGGASGNPFPIIEYKERNLHFEFAAPFFEAETETRYRCFLEGYDGRWPGWNKDIKRDYTNLDAGLYTFRVRAKNIYRHTGREGVFRFKILPPWYQTWWAMVIYGMLFAMLVFFLVKWRSGKLEREKRRLEQVVTERTKEVHRKNQQLEKQTITLQDQSEKLKEMDKVKSLFFANISHEFRTPLTLIMGPLEKMLSKNRDREEGNELKMMFRNSRRLLRLINRLLDLSKLDSGKMKLKPVCEDIIPFIKVAVSAFESLALQNRIDLNLDLGEETEVFLSFDPEKLEEVLCNLLINALKFTPPGGKISVSSRRGGPEGSSFPHGYFQCSVRDTGVGISREKLARIFDRFYQTGDSRRPNYKGSGIGLALTKELVLLHHGNIDVHSSEGEGGGTEFVIRLPLGAQLPGTGEKDGSPGAGFKSKHLLDTGLADVVEDGENGTGEAPEAVDENGGPRDKNIVLVVEDNADVRKYIRGPLESEYTVVEARNGREGIDKARDIIPDLIVSDIMMPEVDGYELSSRLKKDVKTSHIPIVLLTAKASEQSVIAGLETGADDYITKPFNTRILTTRIKNLIELRSHLQQKIQKQMLLRPAEISVSSVDREFIDELQAIIEKNLSDSEFHVEALSKKMYMNRVTLYRKMTALTGESPTRFIRSYRLKRAAQLLRDNAGNVSEVAIMVGFSNLGYFTRCFKEKFHQLPSAYQDSES